MSASIWVFLVAAGLALLWAVPRVNAKTGKAVIVRAAHLSLLGAGTIGAGGIIGVWVTKSIAAIVGAVSAGGQAIVGTQAVVGVLALVLCITWIIGILPNKWIKFDPPDWLAWAGLALPAIAIQIPGLAGDAIHSLITGTGGLIVSLTSSMIM